MTCRTCYFDRKYLVPVKGIFHVALSTWFNTRLRMFSDAAIVTIVSGPSNYVLRKTKIEMNERLTFKYFLATFLYHISSVF